MDFIKIIKKFGTCLIVLNFTCNLVNATSQSPLVTDYDVSLTDHCRALRSHHFVPPPSPSSGPSENSKDYWLLSLDGGGVRGIIQLDILTKLEELTGRRVVDMFDAVAGTSAGGVNAILLTTPNRDDPSQPQFRPQQLLEILVANRHKMLQSKWQSFDGIFATKYKTTGFKKVLQKLLGENTLKNRWLPAVVVTQDLNSYQERLFSTTDDCDHYATDLAMATAAAPTYYKPQRVFPIDDPISSGHFVSDGGTCTNNPVLAGIALLRKRYNASIDHIHVLSLGTGMSNVPWTNEALQRGGELSWVQVISNLCVMGPESAGDQAAESLLGQRYHRFNPILAHANLTIDDVSNANRTALLEANVVMLANNAVEFNEVARLLTAVADAKPARIVQDLSLPTVIPQKSFLQRLCSCFSSD